MRIDFRYQCRPGASPISPPQGGPVDAVVERQEEFRTRAQHREIGRAVYARTLIDTRTKRGNQIRPSGSTIRGPKLINQGSRTIVRGKIELVIELDKVMRVRTDRAGRDVIDQLCGPGCQVIRPKFGPVRTVIGHEEEVVPDRGQQSEAARIASVPIAIIVIA